MSDNWSTIATEGNQNIKKYNQMNSNQPEQQINKEDGENFLALLSKTITRIQARTKVQFNNQLFFRLLADLCQICQDEISKAITMGQLPRAHSERKRMTLTFNEDEEEKLRAIIKRMFAQRKPNLAEILKITTTLQSQAIMKKQHLIQRCKKQKKRKEEGPIKNQVDALSLKKNKPSELRQSENYIFSENKGTGSEEPPKQKSFEVFVSSDPEVKKELALKSQQLGQSSSQSLISLLQSKNLSGEVKKSEDPLMQVHSSSFSSKSSSSFPESLIERVLLNQRLQQQERNLDKTK